MFVKREDFSNAANRTRDPVRPTTLGETIRSSFQTTLKTERSISVRSAEFDEYERINAEVKRVTGKRLFNPQSPGKNRGKLLDRYYQEIDTLKKQYPELNVPTYDEVLQKIGADRQEIREADAEFARGESGLVQGLARFIGTAGGILSDPPIAASMAVGAGASAGILRTALVEGAIAAGVEVPVQGIVQSERTRVGEQPSLGEAAANIALAGAGGAAGGALLKSAFVGTRSLVRKYRASPVKTAEADAAATVLERQHWTEDRNPFGNDPENLARYMDRFDDAWNRMLDDSGEYVRAREDLLSSSTLARPGFQTGAVRVAADVGSEFGAEPAEQYTRRLREAHPELFARQEQVNRSIDDAEARLKEQEAIAADDQPLVDRAEALVGNQGGLDPVDAIRRRARQETGRQRQLDRGLSREADKASRRREKAARKAEAIRDEISQLRADAADVGGQIARASRYITPPDPPGERLRAQIDQIKDIDDPLFSGAVELGERLRQSVPVREAAEDVGKRLPSRNDAADEVLTPADPKTVKDAEEQLEASVTEYIEANPKTYFYIQNELGREQVITGDMLLRDFAEDEKLVREVEQCIRGVFT